MMYPAKLDSDFTGLPQTRIDGHRTLWPLAPSKTPYELELVSTQCHCTGGAQLGYYSCSSDSSLPHRPTQIIDTVEIYHFKRQRKLSLRFLASYLLGMDIQANTHNSIEDAVVALRLYKKYLELEKAGTFQDMLLEIYRYGKKHNWEVQHS